MLLPVTSKDAGNSHLQILPQMLWFYNLVRPLSWNSFLGCCYVFQMPLSQMLCGCGTLKTCTSEHMSSTDRKRLCCSVLVPTWSSRPALEFSIIQRVTSSTIKSAMIRNLSWCLFTVFNFSLFGLWVVYELSPCIHFTFWGQRNKLNILTWLKLN